MTLHYSVCRLDEVPDVFGGRYPGELKMLAGPLGTEDVELVEDFWPA